MEMKKVSSRQSVFVGDVFNTNSYGECVVTDYKSSKDITVMFTTTGTVKSVSGNNLLRGMVKDEYLPNVCGVGYAGRGKYSDRKKYKGVYARWLNIMHRCYMESNTKYKIYGGKGVDVHPDWHNFQNFAFWYVDKCNLIGIDFDNKSHQIDKDKSGLMQYGPSSCELITRQENTEISVSKHFTLIDPKGVKHEVFNLNKFCKENGLDMPTMYHVRQGRRNQQHHKGWVMI